MSTPRIPNQRKANIEHKKRTERYTMLIQQIYDRIAAEASRLATIVDHTPGEPFSFDDYPLTQYSIETLLEELRNGIFATIMAGTSAEWRQSNLVQDLVAKKVLTAYTGTSAAEEEYKRYFQTNPDALKAFQQRRDRGMNLSTRVWNLSEQFKPELEMAISAAIAPGTSAVALAQEVKHYLNEPDLMFRRFRYKDEDGRWRKKWKRRVKDADGNIRFVDCDKDAYRNKWTGPGYYKSSAKNAQRLTRTEINMAYRTAEQERWKQLDFVVGYEVKTTQNGRHEEDMCDCLAGKYPKTFKFVGWHPQCMCYAIPVLKTEDEFWDYDPDAPEESANEVKTTPDGFNKWIERNSERIEAAEQRGTTPYFIRDNQEWVESVSKTSRYNESYLSEMTKRGIIYQDELSERMAENPFNRLDIISLDNNIQNIFAKHGITDIKLRIGIDPDGRLDLSWDSREVQLHRTFFINSEGTKVVDHDLFTIPKQLQGKGVSKQVFNALYEQYKATGVERMDVFANIDVGGYTWARYGFCVEDRDEALSAIRFSALTRKQEDRIVAIIDEHFDSSEDPFPMNEIAKLPYGKDALLGGYWQGFLDLTDEKQRGVFERYLRR